jgi:DNA-binding CsgD family transcriptional regulator
LTLAAPESRHARREHAIEALHQISAALCHPARGSRAVCTAVVQAAADLLGAPWAVLRLHGEEEPIVTGAPRGHEVSRGVPLALDGAVVGTLAVGVPVEGPDLALLATLANHAAAALCLDRERDRIARELHDGADELARSIRSGVDFEPDDAPAPEPDRAPSGHAALTVREREVVALIARGLTNREIGSEIYVSESTVKFHVRNVMRKLRVHHRAEVAYAAARGVAR